MTGFQTQVNIVQAPGVEGSFASNNPRALFVSGPGSLIAGPPGVTVGRFAWCPDGINLYNANNPAANVGAPQGFLANEQEGLNITFLSQANMEVLPGNILELFTRVDVWVKVLNTATVGQKAFANLQTGQAYSAAAGSTVNSFTGTGAFATDVLTVSAVTSGSLAIGSVIYGVAGVAAGTYITAQTSGTPGGVGTYTLSTAPGTIESGTVDATDYVETPWYILSAAATGTLAKIGYGN